MSPATPSTIPPDSGLAGSDALDLLIVGGGPAGTAAAFRAKELGLRAFLIDFDDILKRIRDYPKDKLILPDFGGGDTMAFPAGGELIAALEFDPIDKDDMCERWRGLYARFDVPARTGIELSSVQREGEIWRVKTWDHKAGEERIFRARHVVLALGRGVPRRLDIAGNTDGIAYRLDDPARYLTGPVLVLGGGTSAAEAVLAVSRTKIAADEKCGVYWSFRGTKMPRVSKALAEQFFEAYIGNGNIRSLPDSEPVSVVAGPDRVEHISLRVDRKTGEGRPPETVHLEFTKMNCIACIGEDIPEALLLSLGISMVPVGPQGKKSMAVTPLLETQQPNIYLIGDLLSQSYLEVDDFNAPAETFRQVKHRGNIKSSLRDGVFVAEAIDQRLKGHAQVEVVIRDAAPAPPKPKDARIAAVLGAADTSAESPADPTNDAFVGRLVLVTPTGVDAEEFKLKAEGTTTLGRVGADIAFPQDTSLSDAHASITYRDGAYYLRDDGSRSGTYLRLRRESPPRLRDGDLLRAGRQILVVSHAVRGQTARLEHYDHTGAEVGSYPLDARTTMFGRSGGRSNPDVMLDDTDATLSRFHFSIVAEQDGWYVHDFASLNGTFLKVDDQRKLEQNDVIRVGMQQLRVKLQDELPEKQSSAPVPAVAPIVGDPPVPAANIHPAAGAAVAAPHVTFADQEKSGPLDASTTLLNWATKNDVSIDYVCKVGMCGCDAIRIVSGAEHLNDVTEQEIDALERKSLQPGPYRLACMTRTSGPVVVEVVVD